MMAHLPTGVATPPLLILREYVLSEDAEMGFMCRKGEHDQIGIETVDDVLGVGVVRRVRTLSADEVHDLVLSFSGD